jgi:lipopolysaccharide transport system ATP-binding protein
MSSELAIDCRRLTKRYTLGETLSLKHTLQTLKPGSKPDLKHGFAALDDISFTVDRGSFFGIVGTNGSGKSTLTQVIAGITVPSEGELRVWGRVLPLLEVGSGFHDELTGRENVVLLGSILGLTQDAILETMPRILDFSGVERHADTPLKRYSSGMRARLSFATAICFPAEIYIFDEVLAVVDDDFREKCLAEMRRVNATGRTIIFMSHDLDLVRGACREGMWLEQGTVRKIGPMDEVAAEYEQLSPQARGALVS